MKAGSNALRDIKELSEKLTDVHNWLSGRSQGADVELSKEDAISLSFYTMHALGTAGQLQSYLGDATGYLATVRREEGFPIQESEIAAASGCDCPNCIKHRPSGNPS